ncbi:exodeoxyribonuclease VII small subunit [Crateriforma spongiae]|uniref:exodeoxyribonuclease VII small subunit n=1 Tax=Crateriforma spongiae TaxID=2724528 RepID=UPI00144821EA|nr:exodeoxyribonuclease VII small subunit [Crateriforma spongiae]
MAKKKSTRTRTSAAASDPAESDNDAPKFVFEESVEKIETVVDQLESGDLDLGESLKQYEQAVKELKRCHDYLNRAEQQVRLLAGIDADGQPITTDFDDASGDDLLQKQSARGSRRGAKKRTAGGDGPSDDDVSADSDDDGGAGHLF